MLGTSLNPDTPEDDNDPSGLTRDSDLFHRFTTGGDYPPAPSDPFLPDEDLLSFTLSVDYPPSQSDLAQGLGPPGAPPSPTSRVVLNDDVIREITGELVCDQNREETAVLLRLNKVFHARFIKKVYGHFDLDFTLSKSFFGKLFPESLDHFLVLAYTNIDLIHLPGTRAYLQPLYWPIRHGYIGEISSWIDDLRHRFRNLHNHTEALVIRDVEALKYIAVFLVTSLQLIKGAPLHAHQTLPFEERLFPQLGWVVYPKAFAADYRRLTPDEDDDERYDVEPITTPRKTTSPVVCALHLASRCLFSRHRCVHPLHPEEYPFATADLVLYDPTYDTGYLPTTHHLVIHNINPGYLRCNLIVEHLEFYLIGLSQHNYEQMAGHDDDTGIQESWEEVERRWHEYEIESWLGGFFHDSHKIYEGYRSVERSLGRVKLIEFNNTNADIDLCFKNVVQQLGGVPRQYASRGFDEREHMKNWAGKVVANRPGTKRCEGCGESA
ncbi:hypothetical protein L198_05392 [Cryptococcus wingfieldii CBS 7118]|uniref:Uncharacterized protein n=1 Tax=Cryptococcus wingfieldii CBS 7118 TaxID=1295528 RepID=A0A1E3IY31_9TREE|nr:hypothetical protein L198_05392 [Cryptococcus wingfieldii CBS 7118]ODN93527.1 hypothetical protein L198_05392 [Cryptococcus wingfieldii CBS 7118]